MNQLRPYNTRSGHPEGLCTDDMAAVSQPPISLEGNEEAMDARHGLFSEPPEEFPPSTNQATQQDPMAMMAQIMAALLASSNEDKIFGERLKQDARWRRTTEERRRQTDQVGGS